MRHSRQQQDLLGSGGGTLRGGAHRIFFSRSRSSRSLVSSADDVICPYRPSLWSFCLLRNQSGILNVRGLATITIRLSSSAADSSPALRAEPKRLLHCLSLPSLQPSTTTPLAHSSTLVASSILAPCGRALHVQRMAQEHLLIQTTACVAGLTSNYLQGTAERAPLYRQSRAEGQSSAPAHAAHSTSQEAPGPRRQHIQALACLRFAAKPLLTLSTR
jgi:hypothetical protein